MTADEAKAKIFHWLCSRYHDPGKGSEYIDKDTVRDAINIPEEVLSSARSWQRRPKKPSDCLRASRIAVAYASR